MFKTSAIHPPPNKLGGGLLAEDDKGAAQTRQTKAGSKYRRPQSRNG